MPRNLFPSREERARVIAIPKHRERLIPAYLSEGLSFRPESNRVDWLSDPYDRFACKELASFLSRLERRGLAEANNGVVLIGWRQVYQIESSQEYGTSYRLLMLPPASALHPCLASRDSFSDPDFSIFISGWAGPDGGLLMEDPRIEGAVIVVKQQPAMLEREVWETLSAVAAFHDRKPDDRTSESNRACWSKIRQHAKAAKAQLSPFLEQTVVITADELTIGLRKTDIGGGKVVEVLPNFPGQPPGWLQTFDRFPQVRERYEVPHGAGLTHVVIPGEVQTVLREIKRMPARRVTGERAEAFLRNPFATLGPDAANVIDAAQFEEAREKAGIVFARFTAQVTHEVPNLQLKIGLLIEEGDAHKGSSQVVPFAEPAELEKFIAKVEERIGREAQCCPWHGYELEILGDTPGQLATLRDALQKWRLEKEYKSSEILDLSQYSQRVEGFGLEKPYCLPFIRRKTDAEGWFPDNVIFGVQFTHEGFQTAVAMALSEENVERFERALQAREG